MGFSFKSETFQELTEYALKKAKSLGATDCAVDISEAVGQSVSVRMGEIETIEHTRDKSFGVSVFKGKNGAMPPLPTFRWKRLIPPFEPHWTSPNTQQRTSLRVCLMKKISPSAIAILTCITLGA